MKQGIDISVYQGYINVPIFLSKEQDYIILRARNGYLQDTKFLVNYNALKEGNFNNIEAYGVFYPNLDPIRQAEYLLDDVKNLDIKFLWADVEVNSGVDKATFQTRLKNYLNRVTIERGIGIYTRGLFWNYNLGTVSWINNFKFWLARYNNYISDPYSDDIRTKPINLNNWDTWQWSADGNLRGSEFGVQSKSVDLDRRQDFVSPPEEEEYMKTKCLVNGLNIRENHSTSYKVVGTLYLNDTPEVLEVYTDSISKWYRIGWKQWAAQKYYNYTYLEDVK